MNSMNKNVIIGESMRTSVKKSAIINTIVAMINPRTTHPLINASITSCGFIGETKISSIDF